MLRRLRFALIQQAAWDRLVQESHPVIHAQFADLKALGNPARPSAYSLTFSRGHGALADLMGRWRGPAYDAAGARPDTREPLPHVTVARPARNADAAPRRAGLVWLDRQTIPPVTITIDRIALYTWSDDRRRNLFKIVDVRPLDTCTP